MATIRSRKPGSGRLTAALAASAAVAVLATTTPAPTVAKSRASPLVFEFERYNDAYTGLETMAPPIVRGPLTVRLSSPRYDLAVLANRLELAPAEACRHHGTLWGRFSGDGELIADVELGPFPSRFEDRVRIPEQEKEIEGLVTLEPVDSGYRVTLEQLPRSVSVTIESDLVDGLVAFCRRLSRFVAGDAGCGALDRVLSNPSLALPEPGTEFVVRRDELTPAERRRLNGYLNQRRECVRRGAAGSRIGPAGTSGAGLGDELGGVVDAGGGARAVPG